MSSEGTGDRRQAGRWLADAEGADQSEGRGVAALDARLGRPDLVRRIRDWIARYGPMPFDRFMEMALYEPGLGYYTSMALDPASRPGTLTDYQTSPQVHPAFGHLVARQLMEFWRALDRPNPFVVAELGAGAGELAEQILDGLATEGLPARVVYHAVDPRADRGTGFAAGPSPPSIRGGARTAREVGGSRDRTRRSAVGGDGPRPGSTTRTPVNSDAESPLEITWWSDIAELRQSGVRAHCILSNEFFDALPVHRVAWVGGRLREIYVGWGQHGFVEQLGQPSDAALERWIAAAAIVPPEGWRGEICLRVVPIVEIIATILDRGFVLTIDYGDETANLFQRRDGTLLSYYRHYWSDDVLRRVGEQDLTSHVDFGALERVGREFGLETVGLTTQRDFLIRLGLVEEADRLIAREPTAGRRWQARFALAELVRPDGLGRLKVLIQRRGFPTYEFLP